MPEIKISTKIDNKGLQTGLNAAKGQVDKFDKSISKSGGGGIFGGIVPTFDLSSILQGALTTIKNMAFYGADLADNIERAGISAQSFQKLETMTARGGGNQEEMVKALSKLEQAQGEVIAGDDKMIESFQRLGLSEKEVASMNVDQLYIRVAQAFQDSGRSASAYKDVLGILGKTAKNLVPSFEEVANMGGQQFETMSDRSITALDRLNDKAAELWTNVKRRFSGGVGVVAEWILGKGTVDKAMADTERTQALQRENNIKDLADRQKADAEEKIKKEADKTQKLKEKADKKIAEIRQEAVEQQKEMADRFEERKESIRVEGTRADTLAQMGASVGAGSNPAIAAAQRQVELQKIQNDLAKEQLKATREIAQKIEKVGVLEP
jgi:hypothetical protein